MAPPAAPSPGVPGTRATGAQRIFDANGCVAPAAASFVTTRKKGKLAGSVPAVTAAYGLIVKNAESPIVENSETWSSESVAANPASPAAARTIFAVAGTATVASEFMYHS